jgi:hypothetical protein
MYVWNHISEENIKKTPPHFVEHLSTMILREKIPTASSSLHYSPKSLRNYTHV